MSALVGPLVISEERIREIIREEIAVAFEPIARTLNTEEMLEIVRRWDGDDGMTDG